MKAISISGSLRENVGKKDAKQNRKKGLVPCVVYGGKEQVHFLVEEEAFDSLIFTPYTFSVDLNIEGKEFHAILQEIQFHKVTGSILHVDFLEVNPTKPVVLSIPINYTGNPQGVLKGGKLIKKFRKLKVKGLISNMPDDITIDLSSLDILDTCKVGDLNLENLESLDPKSSVIAFVKSTRAVVEEGGEAKK
ncbi:MAG: 50S ribosomal protein L25/general stress protein Ctc [Bacteroidota bacterium]|nr:50S ribosomal protein L25/general stress protein Ctc [Bacteroidota bacterium]